MAADESQVPVNLRRDHTEILRDAMPIIHVRNVDYRSYSLQIVYQRPLWQCTINPTSPSLPPFEAGKETVKAWDQEEVLQRAKSRVDDRLDG